MKFDEFISLLSGVVTKFDLITLYLDFGINEVQHFDRSLTVSANTEEKPFKIDRKQLKNITETITEINYVTALHMAVAKNQPEVVKWLISQGADAALECTLYTRTYQEAKELKRSKKPNPHTFWAAADYSGKRLVSHSKGQFSALELAEELENDCVDILKLKPPAPQPS